MSETGRRRQQGECKGLNEAPGPWAPSTAPRCRDSMKDQTHQPCHRLTTSTSTGLPPKNLLPLASPHLVLSDAPNHLAGRGDCKGHQAVVVRPGPLLTSQLPAGSAVWQSPWFWGDPQADVSKTRSAPEVPPGRCCKRGDTTGAMGLVTSRAMHRQGMKRIGHTASLSGKREGDRKFEGEGGGREGSSRQCS